MNDNHKLLYCYIPKVACSNWKRVLMVMNGDAADPWKIKTADVHNRSLGYFRYLNQYSPEEIVHRLNTYYKFLFVRHPFERLVSAYRNKFVDSYNYTLFKEMYGRFIIRKYRRNADKKSLKTGDGVSFSEFAEFLHNSDSEFMDWHWKQYDTLCHPCLIYYDFIGHFENLHEEADQLLDILQVSDTVKFPRNKTSQYKLSTKVIARRYLNSLSEEAKKNLYDKYKHDFEMFGYSMGDYLWRGRKLLCLSCTGYIRGSDILCTQGLTYLTSPMYTLDPLAPFWCLCSQCCSNRKKRPYDPEWAA